MHHGTVVDEVICSRDTTIRVRWLRVGDARIIIFLAWTTIVYGGSVSLNLRYGGLLEEDVRGKGKTSWGVQQG